MHSVVSARLCSIKREQRFGHSSTKLLAKVHSPSSSSSKISSSSEKDSNGEVSLVWAWWVFAGWRCSIFLGGWIAADHVLYDEKEDGNAQVVGVQQSDFYGHEGAEPPVV